MGPLRFTELRVNCTTSYERTGFIKETQAVSNKKSDRSLDFPIFPMKKYVGPWPSDGHLVHSPGQSPYLSYRASMTATLSEEISSHHKC